MPTCSRLTVVARVLGRKQRPILISVGLGFRPSTRATSYELHEDAHMVSGWLISFMKKNKDFMSVCVALSPRSACAALGCLTHLTVLLKLFTKCATFLHYPSHVSPHALKEIYELHDLSCLLSIMSVRMALSSLAACLSWCCLAGRSLRCPIYGTHQKS